MCRATLHSLGGRGRLQCPSMLKDVGYIERAETIQPDSVSVDGAMFWVDDILRENHFVVVEHRPVLSDF